MATEEISELTFKKRNCSHFSRL